MASFEYNGKSTENIINVPLLLVTTEAVEPLGSTRSKVEGDRTISRQITNEYGTIYDPLSFNYSLIKSDGTIFTEKEQVTIETWLTSPKLSSKLLVTDCKGNEYSYYGLFTTTNWITGNGGLVILNFTFSVNGAYAFRHFEYYGTSGVYDGEGGGNLISVNDGFEMEFNCQSDELEQYIYPVIEVTAITRDYNSSFALTNLTDGNNKIQVTTNRVTTMRLDCEHCIIGEYAKGVSEDINLNLLKFKDIGWGDVGNVYWPRLIPGKNKIQIDGNVVVKIYFDAPYKKVGGWAI